MILDAIADLEEEDLKRNEKALVKCLQKASDVEQKAFAELPERHRFILAKDILETETRRKMEDTEAFLKYEQNREEEFLKLTKERQNSLSELIELKAGLEIEYNNIRQVKRSMYEAKDEDLLFVKESGENVDHDELLIRKDFPVPESLAFDSLLIRRIALDKITDFYSNKRHYTKR